VSPLGQLLRQLAGDELSYPLLLLGHVLEPPHHGRDKWVNHLHPLLTTNRRSGRWKIDRSGRSNSAMLVRRGMRT
jgi:hypothetical protein